MADTSIAITAGTGTAIDTRTEATNGNHRQVVVLGDPSTNAGVAPVDATAGLKVNLGADNDVTVTGTVDLGATDNAVLDAIAASVAGTLTVGSHAVTNAGTFAVQSTLQAGTAYAGKVRLTDGTTDTNVLDLTNSNPLAVALVDGNGDQITSIGGGTEYTEDAAAAANPLGKALTLIRDDARGGSLTSADGDNVAARGTNAGELYVKHVDAIPITDNSGSLTVDAPVGTPVYVRLSNGADEGSLPIQDDTNAHLFRGITVFGKTSGNVAKQLATDADGHLQVDVLVGNVDIVSGTITTVTTLTGGGIAHDSADSGNPHKMGARATNVDISAVSATNDRTDLVATLTGKLIVQPYSNPENFVSGAITTAMTGTTSTSLIAAPAAGLRNYITTIICSNSHATVGTDIVIQDGSGGTTLLTIPAAAVYGGSVITLPTPLRQPTTATALYCANVTTGASTKVSAVGYKAA